MEQPSKHSSVVWFFALVGGAIPPAFTIVHLIRNTRFGKEDVFLWPASMLLIGKELTTFTGLGLFALAAFLNIVWYMAMGKVLVAVLSFFASNKGE